MSDKLDDMPVTVTMRFADWDRVKSALWAHQPKLGDLDRRIGSAMTEAYDQHRKMKA